MHQHAHSSGHHQHGPATYDRIFALSVALNAAYIGIEAAAGVMFGSLALLADAGHNLSDVLGLLLAWGGHYLSRLPSTSRRTYGWRSTSILAALGNALLLLVAIGGISWEAIERIGQPTPVVGQAVIWVAGIGVLINGFTTMLFVRGRKHDLNLEGAFLHMAADTAVSVGVVISGLVIMLTGASWIDPVTSLLIALAIFIGTWGLLRQSLNMILQAVPEGIDTNAVREFLAAQPEVCNVHDLHIWAMSTTEVALTVHVVRPVNPDDHDAFLATLTQELHDRFGIEHATIQIEHDLDGNACRTSGCSVVE